MSKFSKKKSTKTPGNEVVVSDVGGSSSLSKKQKVFVFVILLVLVLASAGWLAFNKKDTKSTTKQEAKNAAEDTTDYSKITTEQYYATKYDNNKAALTDAAKSAKGAEKSKKLIELSLLALNSGKKDEALVLAKEAEENAQIILTADTLAVVYETSGDFKSAAQWYGMAATRAQSSSDQLEKATYKEYIAKQKFAEKQIK